MARAFPRTPSESSSWGAGDTIPLMAETPPQELPRAESPSTSTEAALPRAEAPPSADPALHNKSAFLGRSAWTAITLVLLALLLCAIVVFRTNDAMANLPARRAQSSARQTLVDQTPWKTAVSLGTLAVTQEELAYARQAEHLADHDVDQAFAAALRSASLKQRTLTGEALALQTKVNQLQAITAADTDAVKQLTPKGGDDLDIAQAQLGLDGDELNDARGDLARASGDQRTEIQQELITREAEVKKFDAANSTGENAVTVAQRYRTLARFLEAWRNQNQRYALLLQAQAAATRTAADLVAQHNTLDRSTARQASAQQAAPTQPQLATDRIASLKRQSLQRQLMTTYDDRIETEGQLADVYGKWAAQVALQHRIIGHLIAEQCIIILLIVLAAIAASAFVHYLAERESLDGRRMRTLSRILRLAVQVLAFLTILLVVFGPPQQLSTVIGLTTAGLTVALQDFILGFVGWFLLMGRNGLGVGDIVEINSVTGVVVDIGIFRTTLLETGNWTAKGHPTGRRVAFNNKFAISGQFFNFSTAGQWMWDELTVTVPAGEDTRAAMERVAKVVSDETGDDAGLAESEWRHSSLQRGLSQFSASPDVNLRPSSGGFDLVVRYITRATGRFERRNRLYGCVLEAVHQPQSSPDTSASTPA